MSIKALCQVDAIEQADLLYELVVLTPSRWQQVMPDDHSEVAPLLPIPNRTVKRLCADDSADSRVKVGHRQASTAPKAPRESAGAFVLCAQHGPTTSGRKWSLPPLRLALQFC